MNQSSLNNPINEIFTQFTNNLRSDLGLKSIDWPNDRILHYVIPPLLLELHAYRQHDKLRGNTPEQRFDEFQRISSDLEFLEQFKCENRDILDRIASDNERLSAFTKTIASALSRDWPTLLAKGFVSDPKPIVPTEITAVGDWHNSEPAARLTIAGTSIFCKGHPSSNSSMVRAVWDAITGGASEALLPMTWEESFRTKDRTWSREVRRQPLSSPHEAEAYYTRIGQLLFLAYLMQISDLHYENVIPHGGYPVLVDFETVGSIQLLPAEAPTLAAIFIIERLANSVLLTGMLPLGVLNRDGTDVSAIAAEELRNEVRVLRNVATDIMHFERHIDITQITDHLPFVRTQPEGNEISIRYEQYTPSIINGFSAAYNAYLINSSEVANAVSEWAETSSTRVLVRNTREYAAVRQAMESHRFKGRTNAVLEHMRRSRASLPRPLVDSECESLQAGFIPSFHCEFTSKNVVDESGRTVTTLKATPYRMLMNHMEHLSAADRGRQVHLITFALDGIKQMQAHRWSNTSYRINTVQRSRSASVEAAVERLAKQIKKAMVSCQDGSVSWESLTVDDKDYLTIRPLSDGIYDGVQGVQYALRQTFAPVTANSLNDNASCSAYVGPVSPLLAEHSPIVDLQKRIDNDAVYDVLGGSAGIILSKRHAQDPAEVKMIDALARHLVNSRNTAADVLQWPLGEKSRLNNASFAHGNAGIGTSLLVAGVKTGHQEYTELGLEALATDERLRMENGLWRDLRIQEKHTPSPFWCHGAVGLAVARITVLELDNRTARTLLPRGIRDRYMDDLRRIADYLLAGIHSIDNFSLCHGAAGSLLTLDYLDRSSIVSGYHAQIAEVCNEVAAFGLGGDWRCGTDTHQSYALMTGLAGILHALRTLISPRPTLEPLLPITRRSMAS